MQRGVKRTDCRRVREKKRHRPESNSTFYCSRVKDMQTLSQSKSKALPRPPPWEELLAGLRNLGANRCHTQPRRPAGSNCSLVVGIHTLDALTRGLNVKDRPLTDTHQSAGRRAFQVRPIVSTQTCSAQISLVYVLQNFRDRLLIFPPVSLPNPGL